MSSSEAANAASSHQEQREQKVLDVMFLCDEWKSSKGGLSTFNREFAINLAEATTGSMKIHCYVSNSDDRDREDAEQHGVNLITARSVPGSADPLECLKFPPSKLPKPHLVIGHGRKLGSPAYSLVQITKCKWIQFVHVYCEDLGKYKESATAAEDTIEENEEKHKMEIELCKAADAVVAIGSRLQQKYSRRLLNVEVKIITPGIFGKFSNESKLAVDRSVVKNFNVSLFGRAAFEDLSLKGYDVVANAIGSLGKNFELTFVGSSPGKQRKVEQWFLDNTCINRNQLTIRRYCSEQEELKVMFYQSDLVALPSRTEGFGLVALEAISAGVPVLVSGESGIAEALQKVEGGNTVIVGSGEDKDEWARRIREMYEESAEEREANAVKLRENYRKVYSWKAECERFKRLIENVVKTANGGEMNIKVDVNYLKPKEQNMQTGMLATESVRCQEVQQPRASATSAASGSVSNSQTEDLHALKVKTFLSIILNYFNAIKPQSIEEFNRFMEYAEKMRLIIIGVSKGSLVITVRCESLMILEDLWTDYSSGHLGEVVQNCFVTEEILKELNLAELRLKTTIDIEEYNACKMFFEKDALRDALSSEFHSTSSTSESPQKKEQWEKSEQKTKIMETAKLEDQKLNIKVDVEHMKRADQDAYNTASVLALEPAGYQKASTASGTKRKRHSDADLEDPQLLKKKVLCLIAMNYLDTTPAQSRDERNEFKEYLQEMKVFIIGVSVGSLVITVKCDSLSSLEELWEDYSCGLLDKMVRDCFVTEKIMKELNLAELKLKTTMDIEEYNAYKLYFLEKDALRGASSSEFHSICSTSESPQNQEELKKWKQKTKIVETEKLKGTLPLTVIPTTGYGKELIGKAQGRKGMLLPLGSSTSDPEEELEELRRKLQTMKGASSSGFHSISSTSESPQNQEELKKWKQKTKIVETEKLKGMLPLHGSYTSDPEEELEELGSSSPPLLSTIDLEEKLGSICVNLKMLRVEGGFPVLQFSTIDLEKKLDELCIKFQRLRMKGTLPPPELFTADLEEELKGLRTELNRLRMKGSSHPLVSTTEVQLDELLKQLQKWKEGMLPLPGFSTFDLEEKLGKLCKKLRIMEGSLHSLPTTSLKEKLKQVFEKSRMLRMRGSFPVLDLEKKLAELRMELQRFRMEGTLPPPELFTADLEKELEQLRTELITQIVEGSSRSIYDTIETVLSLRRELEKVKMEALENAMYPTIRSGLAKFDVSLPEELQNYVSYLLNESAKLVSRKQVPQSPRALEELREAMDQDELRTFLAIHIREVAWQVVMLFTDELPSVKPPWDCYRRMFHEDEDEDEDEEVFSDVIYSSTSGILNAWPTKYDPALVTLCNAITNKDWKVTRLILYLSRISDEGLKNLSTALTQSELYSLTLYDIGLQSQGLEHLCTALTSDKCGLTNLNVNENKLGDVGIMHLSDALTSVNCTLTSLNVSENWLGDEGMVHLCNALTSVDCTLTSLNVSDNWLGDEDIMHLCNALTSVNCKLTSLNVSRNLLRDKGIMHLCNALISVNCLLTSLNVSDNKLEYVGLMHLCNALTSVNCRLTSLNVSDNELEDIGIMHLCNVLTSVDCTLTSLNVSDSELGDNGLKHLCDALTSSNCALTKLKVGFNRLEDGGIKELSEVLTNGFCTLTSLDIRGNKFGDEGIKHLCNALTDTKCKLRSLNLRANSYVTDDGKKYLSQMLTGTDWEHVGALRLYRSTTK